jgi:geranylgeranyl diphosphate synthase type I
MHEGKTARYTFEGPLHLGCLLAQGSDAILKGFTAYALPLGKAFQLRDDILGVYGDEKELGKPVGSDIIEGKQTLLLIKALEQANDKQKHILSSYFGKPDLSPAELEQVRAVIRETGSLRYSQTLAETFVKESLAALEVVDFKNEEAKQFLKGIAQYIIERKK